MLRFLFFCISIFSIPVTTAAQQTISGILLSSETKQPIPYASIGIARSTIGTTSNPGGSFTILIPAGRLKDTLLFTSLGFINKSLPIGGITGANFKVYLDKKIIALKPVIISSVKPVYKTIESGNRSWQGGTFEPDTVYSGRSVALLVNDEPGNNLPLYVEKARLRIFRNNLPSYKFRVRLMAVDVATGEPGNDLLEENIIVSSSKRKGWLDFDLSAIGQQVNGPFFLCFEQITDVNDRAAIADGYRDYIRKHPKRLKTDSVEFEGKMVQRQQLGWGAINLPATFIATSGAAASKRYTCYVKETGFAKWEKVRGIVAATVLLSSRETGEKIAAEKPCANTAACKAEKLCKDFLETTGMAGMQVCVSVGNKIKWSGNFGYADLENKILVNDSIKFRINSISKSMTSVALLQLVSKGLLDLDAPVQKYLPEYPLKKYPFTTRQLAGHLAGFRDYKEDDITDYIRTEHFNNATEALRIFKNDSLLFEPGTRFSYSGFGWNLIGALIEKLSGQDYLSYMEQHLWQPLQLQHTMGDNVRTSIRNRGKFYDAAGEPNDLGDLSYKYPAGGLLSTSKDLMYFGNALLHGNFIDPKLRQQLFETQYTSDHKPTGYGLGWYVGKDRDGRRMWYHTGDSFSGSSALILYPDDDVVVAFLANGQQGVNFDVREIGKIFLDAAY